MQSCARITELREDAIVSLCFLAALLLLFSAFGWSDDAKSIG